MSLADDIYIEAFSKLRLARSIPYKMGVMEALSAREERRKPTIPFHIGTLERDAFEYGMQEGGKLWLKWCADTRPARVEKKRMERQQDLAWRRAKHARDKGEEL